jgi:hypothetical protein
MPGSASYTIELIAMWLDATIFIFGILLIMQIREAFIECISFMSDNKHIQVANWKQIAISVGTYLVVATIFGCLLPIALWIPFTDSIDLGVAGTFFIGMFTAALLFRVFRERLNQAVLQTVFRLFLGLLRHRRAQRTSH